VGEVAWAPDGTRIISGGLDRTLRVWDVTTTMQIAGFRTKGFVQSVGFHPNGTYTMKVTANLTKFTVEKNILFAGNTAKHVLVLDSRQPTVAAVFENDSMINSLYVA
jgi:hypothetical protein